MADVRSLLKTERAARRIQHEHASYSTTGTLLCTICHLQLKSETLWPGHLKSAGHITKAQKFQEARHFSLSNGDGNKKKRKASSGDEEATGTLRKRTKAVNGLPEGFFDSGSKPVAETTTVPSATNEIQIPSRPATPSKPVEEVPKRPEVDEDEWAAFEADIATSETITAADTYNAGVISAPAMTAAELAVKDKEEENRRRKEQQEAELEGDKEDAARKLEDGFEEMEGLEQRVKKLREKREALRLQRAEVQKAEPAQVVSQENASEDDEDDDDDEDSWGFR